MFTTTGKGGRRREGFPYSALSSLLSGGAPGLGCASPPLPAFSGGGGASCLWGRLLLLRSGDRVPNTPAASLRDARLTDKCFSQSPLGPHGKVEFPNELIGQQGGRALVIGVLFGVESSKQPWSNDGGEGSRCQLPLAGAGRGGEHTRQKEPQPPHLEEQDGTPPKASMSGRPLQPRYHNC